MEPKIILHYSLLTLLTYEDFRVIVILSYILLYYKIFLIILKKHSLVVIGHSCMYLVFFLKCTLFIKLNAIKFVEKQSKRKVK